jgi:hypothetical protein
MKTKNYRELHKNKSSEKIVHALFALPLLVSLEVCVERNQYN